MGFKVALAKVAALSVLALAASAASAVELKFALTGSYTANWTLDSTPVPDEQGDDYFGVYDVPGSYSGAVSNFADLYFFTASSSGGMLINDFNADPANQGVVLLVTNSLVPSQLYSGSLAHPVFSPGVYTMENFDGPGLYTLTISAVPEPATVASMLAGLGFVGAALRRRRR